MTTLEWIVFGTLVALLWLPFIYYLLTPPPKPRPTKASTVSVFNEIARWREASERTYARQGIKR